jgi:hypothetical protein
MAVTYIRLSNISEHVPAYLAGITVCTPLYLLSYRCYCVLVSFTGSNNVRLAFICLLNDASPFVFMSVSCLFTFSLEQTSHHLNPQFSSSHIRF